MQNKFYKIFKKKSGIIIGAIHFPPLLGYPEFPGFKVSLNNALKDLKAFESGGVDGIIFENNYDIPHTEKVGPETVAIMTFLGEKIKKETNLPIGVSVLWNDFRAALSIAKTIGARFIRIPVFVDRVKTNYGIINGNPEKVKEFQEKIKAGNIILLVDIQVKHAQLLNKRPIEKSALEAIKSGADSLILTGKWTGDAPDLRNLVAVRKAVADFPLLVGSGADKENISELLKYANGAIVSTSLKEGASKNNEVNIKTWKQRISKEKVKNFIDRIGR
ncbi:MAG: BtpA/SgcQ family protein [bacterium]|nr:BtpA/SgcQ family protein [bacterium]